VKTIGLIGGMSWESSSIYYKKMNEYVKKELGLAHSCECVMYSVDFQPIKESQHKEEWNKLREKMICIAKNLESIGAKGLVICTNTMHLLAEDIATEISIPLIHIADATGEEIQKSKLKKIGLLATKFTMERDFYKKRLQEKYDVDVIIPDEYSREIVHKIIYEELVLGVVKKESKLQYQKIVKELIESGAEGIILGCTEICMLLNQADVSVPVFDTTEIHIKKAVQFALNKERV